jgi:DNA polymerase-4
VTLRSLLVDFNSYFASVEQQVEPRLRGKPLGVVPMLADTTVCIAASVEAKTFGVKTGTKVADAKRLCPGIEFVVARHEIYIDFHHRAVPPWIPSCPVRRRALIDEMDCELTGAGASRAASPSRATVKADHRERGRRVPAHLDRHRPQHLHRQDRLGHGEARRPGGDRALGAARAPLPPRGARALGRRQADGKRLHREASARCATSRALEGGAALHLGRRGRRHHATTASAARRSPTARRRPAPSRTQRAGAEQPQTRGRRAILKRLTQKAAMRLRKAGYYAGRMSVGVKYIDGTHGTPR